MEDEIGYFLLTYSIVEHHTFILDKSIEELRINITHVAYYEGNRYSVFAPGYPFLCVPSYAIGKTLWFLLKQLGVFSNPEWWFKRFSYWSMMMVSLLSTSLTSVLIYRLSKSLNFTEKTSLIVSLTYAYGTIAWVYAKSAFSQSASALFVMLGIYLAIKAVNENNKKKIIFSGLAIGYAIVIRYSNMLLAFPLSFYIIFKTRKFGNIAIFLLSVFCNSLILLFYNYINFGHPFTTGYHFIYQNVTNRFSFPIYVGMYGLLFGISRGLIPYSPVLILSIIGMYPWKKHKEEYFLFISSFFSVLIFYSSWPGWFGGPYWGARHIFEVVSCFTILICPVIEKYGSKLWFWVIYHLLLAYSIFASLVGVSWRLLVPFLGYYPIFGHLEALINPDTLLSYIIYTFGFPIWWTTILLSILVTLSYIFIVYPSVFSPFARKLTKGFNKISNVISQRRTNKRDI